MRYSLAIISAVGLAAAAPAQVAPANLVIRQNNPDVVPISSTTSTGSAPTSTSVSSLAATSSASSSDSSSSGSSSGSSGGLSGLLSNLGGSDATSLLSSGIGAIGKGVSGGVGAIGKGVAGGVSGIIGAETKGISTGIDLSKGITKGVIQGVKGIGDLVKKAQANQDAQIQKLIQSGQLPASYAQQPLYGGINALGGLVPSQIGAFGQGFNQGLGYATQPPLIPGAGGQVWVPVTSPGRPGRVPFTIGTNSTGSARSGSSAFSGFLQALKNGYKDVLNSAQVGYVSGNQLGAQLAPGIPGFGIGAYGQNPYGLLSQQQQPDLEIYTGNGLPAGAPALVGTNGTPFGFFAPVGYQIVPNSQGAAIVALNPGTAAPIVSTAQQTSLADILKKASQAAAKAEASVQNAAAAAAIASPPPGYTYVPVPISALASGRPIILSPQGKIKRQ